MRPFRRAAWLISSQNRCLAMLMPSSERQDVERIEENDNRKGGWVVVVLVGVEHVSKGGLMP